MESTDETLRQLVRVVKGALGILEVHASQIDSMRKANFELVGILRSESGYEPRLPEVMDEATIVKIREGVEQLERMFGEDADAGKDKE